MAIIRVEKTKDYTVMSNFHLKDKNLSLKAKGLMSLMLSLPENWDYSIKGLVAICKENETSVTTALKELKENGYLRVEKKLPNKTQSGRIEYEYVLYENKIPTINTNIEIKPISELQELEKQGVENLGLEFLGLENQGQLNTNNKILNNKENIIINNNTKEKNIRPQKHKYGEYNNVLLSDEEVLRLNNTYGEETTKSAITYLDEYIEMKGYKAKSHYLCIKKWVINALKEHQNKNNIKECLPDRLKRIFNEMEEE